jgi:LacI family transcriptional regulator
MATMKDVAVRSGVSETTVSHVLNNTRAVAEKTRLRVSKAMRDLNFHGNAAARRLARGQGDSVGLIISDVENPFFPALIKSFENAALRHGYDVLLCTTNYDPARTLHALRKMVANQTPGVAVMTSSVSPESARVLADADIASVFLDADKVTDRQSSLHLDYAKGTLEGITYLHNLGHRRLTLVAGPQDRASHVAYRRGVEQAGKRVGVKVRVIEAGSDLAGGAGAIERLLTSPQFPTAILCSSDLTAIGALRALVKAGIRVPQDVSLIGADDILLAALTDPPLTTVRIPRELTGELAFEALRALFTGEARRGAVTVVPTELVVRGSTGAAPTSA